MLIVMKPESLLIHKKNLQKTYKILVDGFQVAWDGVAVIRTFVENHPLRPISHLFQESPPVSRVTGPYTPGNSSLDSFAKFDHTQ
jgi:hypothetical protein